MPYLEDGETWSQNQDIHEQGMAENMAGHKKFSEYKLPRWSKHPLSHPYTGVNVGPKDYMYSAGDGFCNPMCWSIAHVGARFGDLSILERCTEEEMSRKDSQGRVPATYAVLHGTAWCLQWLVEQGADTSSPDYSGHTPHDHIWMQENGLHLPQQEWLLQALKKELVEKNNVKAQEYVLVRRRASGIDKVAAERLDQAMLRSRKYWFNTGEYKIPYEVPPEKARILDLPLSKVAVPEVKQGPPLPAALLFPGQGSQYVGMLKDHMERPAVRYMLSKARQILGWDPEEVMLNGPETTLQETRFCQPVMFIAGLAAMDILKDAKPDVVERPQAVAGLSLGEYTALVAAGVLDFEDGLRLVQLRAEAMQRATDLEPQAMCSIAGLDRVLLDRLCEEASDADPSPSAVVKVANWLFPTGFTCGGSKGAVEELCKRATAARALQARVIKAGGAFHTELMRPAAQELHSALDMLAEKMRPPRCALYLNVTGKRVKAKADPATFIEYLKMQLTSEVLWEPSVRSMIIDGVQDFYELGPLKQLKSMMKRIDNDAFKRMENVTV